MVADSLRVEGEDEGRDGRDARRMKTFLDGRPDSLPGYPTDESGDMLRLLLSLMRADVAMMREYDLPRSWTARAVAVMRTGTANCLLSYPYPACEQTMTTTGRDACKDEDDGNRAIRPPTGLRVENEEGDGRDSHTAPLAGRGLKRGEEDRRRRCFDSGKALHALKARRLTGTRISEFRPSLLAFYNLLKDVIVF